MDTTVFLAVLAAAAMHAGWNAVVKIGLDQFLSVTLVSVAAGVVAASSHPSVRSQMRRLSVSRPSTGRAA